MAEFAFPIVFFILITSCYVVAGQGFSSLEFRGVANLTAWTREVTEEHIQNKSLSSTHASSNWPSIFSGVKSVKLGNVRQIKGQSVINLTPDFEIWERLLSSFAPQPPSTSGLCRRCPCACKRLSQIKKKRPLTQYRRQQSAAGRSFKGPSGSTRLSHTSSGMP